MYRLWLTLRYYKRVRELDPEMSRVKCCEVAWGLSELMTSNRP